MTIRTIEVPMYRSSDLAHRLDAARLLAEPLGAHIAVTYAMGDAVPQLEMVAALSVADDWGSGPSGTEPREDATHHKAEFDRWCSRNNLGYHTVHHRLDSLFITWREDAGPIEAVVTRRGRLSDLIVVDAPQPGDAVSKRCFEAAVFASGRPVLAVPKALPQRPLNHVMVAWDGSLEATHAIALSMPILRAAEQVSIFTAASEDEPVVSGNDLASSLRWHGMEARCVHSSEPTKSAAEALLAAARDDGVTLIVMGTYSQDSLPKTLPRGMTSHVLRLSEIPILTTH